MAEGPKKRRGPMTPQRMEPVGVSLMGIFLEVRGKWKMRSWRGVKEREGGLYH